MNSPFTRTIQCIAALAVMSALALPALAANPGISATLEPSHVAVGEAAELTVTITGGSADEAALPHVDGLTFTSAGQSSEYQAINGAVTASISHTYLVTASRAGQFTIPALKIGRGSNAVSTRPVVLRVSGAAPQAQGQPAPALPAPNVSGADDDQAVSNNGGQAFLRLMTPKRALHVGELVPVQIKAYFRGGVQAKINGLPTLSSDAFTLNALDDKPAQTQEEIDGQPYVVVTWTTALSAVKAGDYSLSLELPVVLTVRGKARRPRDPFGDAFSDDSFFQGFFGNSVEKQATLTSKPDALSIRPLPSANRPADFSDALGQFTVTAEASPNHVTAGDPITLHLTVTGRGNFDRVSSGLLANSPEWKSYKPVARFAPADNIGSEGTKTFEQAVVPLQAGHLDIPPLSFSYFDPETAKYVTRTTTPLAIDVAPAANLSAAAPAAAPTGNVDRPEFAPNRVEPGQFISTLQPLFLQPRFLIANFLAWVGVGLGVYFFRRRTRRAGDPRFARARQADRAIRNQLTAMDSAIKQAETAAFFAAARGALQQRLGQRWDLPPETITLSEINARLNGEADGIRPVFQMADQVAYSHENLPAGDLAAQATGDKMKFSSIIMASLVLLGAGAMASAADSQTGFDQANTAFSQKNYGRAASEWQAIITRQGFSAPVLFNLANAYYRDGKLGPAILNYERAQLLAPDDGEIAFNLHVARAKTGLADRPTPWFDRAAHFFSLNTLSWLGAAAVLLIVAGFMARKFNQRNRFGWRMGMTASVCVLLGTVLAVGIRRSELSQAIVTVKNTPVYISPVTGGQPLYTLAEGQTVALDKAHGEFVLVETNDGQRGWVKRADISPLIPAIHGRAD